jgi:hypothetical protein
VSGCTIHMRVRDVVQLENAVISVACRASASVAKRVKPENVT